MGKTGGFMPRLLYSIFLFFSLFFIKSNIFFLLKDYFFSLID